MPNAFELFGIDFLVSDLGPDSISTEGGQSRFQLHLLEANSEPAIELTGPRLRWILEDLFIGIGKVCVEPFFREHGDEFDIFGKWGLKETRSNFRKCLDVQMGVYR
jgi:tubulin---tyrosine ligase